MTDRSMIAAQTGISVDPARNLGRAALDFSVTLDPGALAMAGIDAPTIDRTIALLDEQMIPAKRADPECKNPLAIRLRDALGLIGRKVRPEASPSAAKDWVGALVICLSDLPYRVSTEAADEAKHHTYEFLNQVEIVIREKAKSIEDRFRLARSRLNRLRREIENPPVALPAPEPMIWTQAKVDELIKTEMGQAIAGLGVAGGWLIKNDDGTFVPNPEKGQADER